MKELQIAIDGPAAAGKSTVAKRIAASLGYIYIDTGAMYRALTFEAIQSKIDLQNGLELANLLKECHIQLKAHPEGQKVFVNGIDVTSDIRSQTVSNNVSFVALHKEVREIMVERQRQLSLSGGVVMDGRDIGTHVMPYAQIKIFLKASVKERALRRYKELQAGDDVTTLEQLQSDIALRDERDTTRQVSPLIKAKDAVEIDTTTLNIDEVVNKIMSIVKERA